MQVKQRQDLRDLRRAAHVRGQDRASKPPSLAGGLVHPFVVDPRGLHLDRASPAHDLATLGITVADGQSPPFFVAIGFGHFEVGLYLGLESGSEHLFGSLAGDLVEVEHDLPTSSFVVVYPVPRCTLPADAGTSALPFDCSKGRYTTSLTKSSIHNFRSYLAVFCAWWSTASTPIRSFHTVSGKEILGSPHTGCCIVTSLETVIRLVKKSCAPRTDHNLCRLE